MCPQQVGDSVDRGVVGDCDDWGLHDVADRPGHDRRYSLDTSKLESLGWTPRERFDDGLAKTVRWYRDNERWWRPIKDHDPEFRKYYQGQYGNR